LTGGAYAPNAPRLSTPLCYGENCYQKINPLTPSMPCGYSYKDWVKPSFVIFDIRALWRSRLGVRVPGCQKLQMTA